MLDLLPPSRCRLRSDLAPPLGRGCLSPSFTALQAAFAMKGLRRVALGIPDLARRNLSDHDGARVHVGGAALTFGASGHQTIVSLSFRDQITVPAESASSLS